MENRGYEEDSLNLEDHPNHPHHPPHHHQPPPSSISPSDQPENHVYEDIAINPPQKIMQTSPENSQMFQRNLTLPLRRPRDSVFNKDELMRYSVRVTSNEKNNPVKHENKQIDENLMETSEKPRRRRKKDCKHCRIKASEEGKILGGRIDFDKNDRNVLEPIFMMPEGRLPNFGASGESGCCINSCAVFSITNNNNNNDNDKNEMEPRLITLEEERTLLTPSKHRMGMKVNSIYSQEQWRGKEGISGAFGGEKEGHFQRAYSLPIRTQSPASQNRVNLRRSVRGEPPPQPARLRKNRHGWTLHFARPLDGTSCTKSIILLLIAILALLSIGAIALYIVFEPEKLQIIQQYLRSNDQNYSIHHNLTDSTQIQSIEDSITTETSTTPLPSYIRVLSTTNTPFPEDYITAVTEVQETEMPVPSTVIIPVNITRHCDDCYEDEVCVALVDEEVPVCRIGPDRIDPTGCAGLCVVNKQKCHRLDHNALRCVEVEHYCLDDEWTCSNTLCIPSVKRCDGHMNCYDHSDEYNCNCDLETHFQCGNETSCLPIEKRCDGKIDCWDATDEINCTLGDDLGRSCPSANEFTCSTGQCIQKTRFCDGYKDCTDGSDEPRGCRGRCNKHEFTCRNGRCITRGLKCNGIDDCGDQSDEQHCRDRATPSSIRKRR